jgi:SulP family sulfate permease
LSVAVRWGAELRGALNGTAAMLPFVLVYGVIAFGVLGPAAAPAALGASLTSVVLGGLLAVLFTRCTLPVASPSASSCLILSVAVAGWAREGSLAPALLFGLVGCTVALAGLGFVLLGLLRAGSLVGFVPQPVLSGFVNGVAVLIALSQLPVLHTGTALAVALATGALMALLRWRAPQAPAALLAMVVASAGVALVDRLWPLGLEAVGALAPTLPLPVLPALLAGDAGRALLLQHAGSVAGTALLLALIGTLESALNLAAVEQPLRTRSDPNQMLLALGFSNLALGLLGALPVVYLRLRAMATAAAGGRSWRAMALGSVLIALVLLPAAPLGAWLPRAVVAGILVVLAWTLVDSWSLGLLRRGRGGDPGADRALSLAVVAVVCAVTVLAGFAAGVALGVLLSFVLLVRALQRSLVRTRGSGAALPSRRVYAAAQEAALAPLRAGIDIVELEGALFFGNVQRLRREVEAAPPGAPRRALVLDLRRVSAIDASAAVTLAALRDTLAAAGTPLLLAGVTTDNRHGAVLLAHEAAGGWRMHADTDLAVEAAERLLLAEHGAATATQAVPLPQARLFEGLTEAHAARLAALMPARTLAAGERLFREGDAGDALYVLTAGSVTVRDAASGQRFVSFSPGMCFGETAVLDGAGRTADAVADEPSTVHRLASEDLAQVRRDAPDLAAQLYLNLARHLSERLRSAALAWRRAAG